MYKQQRPSQELNQWFPMCVGRNKETSKSQILVTIVQDLSAKVKQRELLLTESFLFKNDTYRMVPVHHDLYWIVNIWSHPYSQDSFKTWLEVPKPHLPDSGHHVRHPKEKVQRTFSTRKDTQRLKPTCLRGEPCWAAYLRAAESEEMTPLLSERLQEQNSDHQRKLKAGKKPHTQELRH